MKFTQYMLPDGRRKFTSIEMPPEVEAIADELEKAGWAFEIEVLTNGMINMDCCDEDEQLTCEVCPNGPEVPKAVEKMARESYKLWLGRGKPQGVGNRPGRRPPECEL